MHALAENPLKSQWLNTTNESDEAFNSQEHLVMLDELREAMNELAELVSMNNEQSLAEVTFNKAEDSSSEKTPSISFVSHKIEDLSQTIADKVTFMLRSGVEAEVIANSMGENLLGVAGQIVRDKIAAKDQREKLEQFIALQVVRTQAEQQQVQQQSRIQQEAVIREINTRVQTTQQINQQQDAIRQYIENSIRESIIRSQQAPIRDAAIQQQVQQVAKLLANAVREITSRDAAARQQLNTKQTVANQIIEAVRENAAKQQINGLDQQVIKALIETVKELATKLQRDIATNNIQQDIARKAGEQAQISTKQQPIYETGANPANLAAQESFRSSQNLGGSLSSLEAERGNKFELSQAAQRSVNEAMRINAANNAANIAAKGNEAARIEATRADAIKTEAAKVENLKKDHNEKPAAEKSAIETNRVSEVEKKIAAESTTPEKDVEKKLTPKEKTPDEVKDKTPIRDKIGIEPVKPEPKPEPHTIGEANKDITPEMERMFADFEERIPTNLPPTQQEIKSEICGGCGGPCGQCQAKAMIESFSKALDAQIAAGR